MKRRLTQSIFLLLALLLALPLAGTAATLPDFVALSKQLKPAVVNISTAKKVKQRRPAFPGRPQSPYNDFFDEFFDHFMQNQPQAPRKQQALGSGFIISKDGYILTNDHVVDGADVVTVKLADGRTFDAMIKGQDEKLDLALLKIDTGEDLPVAVLGDSDTLEVGQWVMAIGNPFGLEQTVTAGIVSAKGRVIGAGPYDDFIQTDASINPGNSGGPLFDTDGRVVGINTAIVAGGQGIGFATPVNAAKNIISQLKETGHVTRGWLGVTVQPMTDELAQSFKLKETKGALVAEVVPDSPADKAGVKRGDIILTYEGNEVNETKDLPRLVAATPIDKQVDLGILREGKNKTLKVKIARLDDGKPAASESAASEKGQLGLALTNITPELAQRYGLEGSEGVLITGIDPNSSAADSNLRRGDLILEVNGKSTGNIEAFRTAVAKVKKDDVLRLLVKRGESILYTTLKAD
ncbi:DegQ family serine endoprotease [Trichloromonas sp.]|uniref:DegQ family serine endoprotease n=1 Tax=Trichloromonas sp. TaxID=3069249 RepID=UPI003D818A5B